MKQFPHFEQNQWLSRDFPSLLRFRSKTSVVGRRVIPAKAGIQEPPRLQERPLGIAAFAGMTKE
jgi:hypothetical protein